MPTFLRRLTAWQRLAREAFRSALCAPPGPPERPAIDRRRIRLGASTVVLDLERHGADGPILVNLHENETTSVDAAHETLVARASAAVAVTGRLLRLRARGRRIVVFWARGRPWAFDPNRIYTDAGLRATLARHASLAPSAVAAVERLRDAVLASLDARGGEVPVVVALHNNAGGAFVVQRYAEGGVAAGDAAAVTVAPDRGPADFFLVTDPIWFERLGRLGFHVVLQSPEAADDGSLSVWFQRQGRSYVNVEAMHGHRDEQAAMLRAVFELADGAGTPAENLSRSPS